MFLYFSWKTNLFYDLILRFLFQWNIMFTWSLFWSSFSIASCSNGSIPLFISWKGEKSLRWMSFYLEWLVQFGNRSVHYLMRDILLPSLIARRVKERWSLQWDMLKVLPANSRWNTKWWRKSRIHPRYSYIVIEFFRLFMHWAINRVIWSNVEKNRRNRVSLFTTRTIRKILITISIFALSWADNEIQQNIHQSPLFNWRISILILLTQILPECKESK